MVEVNKNINVNAVSTADFTNIQNAVISSEDTMTRSVASQPTSENVIDIGNLYNQGNGIKIQNRTISVDSTVVAMQDDLEDFLTQEDISNKADKAVSLEGYGILNGVTFEIIEDDDEEE